MSRGSRLSPSRYLRLSSPRRREADDGASLPPHRMRSGGETDESFIAVGDQLVDLLTENAGLCADSRVLEIGCGYGRLAHALRRHGFVGTYLGIDALKPQVRWCTRRLGGDGFRFRHVDIANERYNPEGRVAVHDLELGDARFDVIVAINLFTHMWPDDVLTHLRVVARSLALDGRAAATFFLLDHERQDAEGDQFAPRMPFERQPGCRYESADDPLHRVGYEPKWLVLKGAEAGLVPAGSPLFGAWPEPPVGRQRQPDHQDLLVFNRLEDALRRR